LREKAELAKAHNQREESIQDCTITEQD